MEIEWLLKERFQLGVSVTFLWVSTDMKICQFVNWHEICIPGFLVWWEQVCKWNSNQTYSHSGFLFDVVDLHQISVSWAETVEWLLLKKSRHKKAAPEGTESHIDNEW